MRIAKFMAAAGIASRRKSEEIVRQGHVKVNGKIIYDPATNVEPEADVVQVDGRKIEAPDEKIYIMLNKPLGCVSTCQDDRGRKTVLDYVKMLTAASTRLGGWTLPQKGFCCSPTTAIWQTSSRIRAMRSPSAITAS